MLKQVALTITAFAFAYLALEAIGWAHVRLNLNEHAFARIVFVLTILLAIGWMLA